MKFNAPAILRINRKHSFPGLTNVSSKRQGIYVYPITPYTYKEGSNDYILRVKQYLEEAFEVVNQPTRLGILDIILKLPKCNIIYLNWIEDVVDKRFGYLQVPLLFLLLLTCKLTGIRIAWFIHNDVSHSKKNFKLKKIIRKIMMRFADVSFCHSQQLSIKHQVRSLKVFDHPVEETELLKEQSTTDYDLLVWGSVSPYKGIMDFARFNYNSDKLNDQKILVAGRFSSLEFYTEVLQFHRSNIELINKVQDEEALIDLFSRSKYVLFCYQSASVLSSGALCKTLSYGKTIIGPNLGAFKELGEKGLIYTYNSFDELAHMLQGADKHLKPIDKQYIKQYIQKTSWQNFKNFLVENLSDPKIISKRRRKKSTMVLER